MLKTYQSRHGQNLPRAWSKLTSSLIETYREQGQNIKTSRIRKSFTCQKKLKYELIWLSLSKQINFAPKNNFLGRIRLTIWHHWDRGNKTRSPLTNHYKGFLKPFSSTILLVIIYCICQTLTWLNKILTTKISYLRKYKILTIKISYLRKLFTKKSNFKGNSLVLNKAETRQRLSRVVNIATLIKTQPK